MKPKYAQNENNDNDNGSTIINKIMFCIHFNITPEYKNTNKNGFRTY